MGNCIYFVLLYLFSVDFHVFSCRFRLDLSDPLLRQRQPIRELLQLLLLKLHQDFMEPGEEEGESKDRETRKWACRGRREKA